MNLILFESAEIERPLPRDDRRARHILDVLRRGIGDTFDVGRINGPRGKATLASIDDKTLTLEFAWSATEPRDVITFTLMVGLPRPQTARDILRDATTLGVNTIHFVRTEKSEASYMQSTLWSTGEWRRHAIAGAEQAFATQIPEVTHGRTIKEIVGALPADATRLALDNYESPARLGEIPIATAGHHVIAIGGERGWSATERTILREQGFNFTHLGARVLRTETAVVAALSIVRSRCGLM